MKNFRSTIILLTLFLFTTLACSMPSNINITQPQATPTPLGDTLPFSIPLYAYTLTPGETVPGTALQYVGENGDSIEVTIDGLTALKSQGDSFIWSGVLAPGVTGDYNLRLAPPVLGELPVAGPVNITIFNPEPIERERSEPIDSTLEFTGIVVNYWIPEGRQVPGTPLVYESTENQSGSRLAVFSGLSGYSKFAVGDSLNWRGNLRDNIVVDYSLRVASIGDEGLRLGGTANIWIE